MKTKKFHFRNSTPMNPEFRYLDSENFEKCNLFNEIRSNEQIEYRNRKIVLAHFLSSGNIANLLKNS